MTLLEAALLGALQGLGEFLPISSSGHLIAVPWLLGWEPNGLSFDVALHMGTLAAVLWAFAGDWIRMLSAAWGDLRARRPFSSPDGRLLLQLAAATVPAAVVGLAFDEWIETHFRSPGLVAASLALMGLVLGLADRWARSRRGLGEMAWSHALLIGVAQTLALVPGVSRSGVTIAAGLLLGYRRDDAARYSFLLATPVTLGAGLLKVPDLAGGDQALAVILTGVVVSAVVGLLSIRWLLRYVRGASYMPFVWYRLGLAALIAIALLAGR